ncbi:MAG: hypothetical protein LBN20_04845 [Endomicrobium sp.]|jgi:cell division transport system permease protein|nr:hypothetical protein [Endomicrobium sp.]
MENNNYLQNQNGRGALNPQENTPSAQQQPPRNGQDSFAQNQNINGAPNLQENAPSAQQQPPRRPRYNQPLFVQTHGAKKLIKFVVLALFSAFSVLLANHYYYLQNYALNLSSDINIVVFIDKASKDDAVICDAIEALGLVTIDEYVNSKDVYARAVEANPFLKDVVVPGSENSFQSYVKVSPKELPTEDYMADLRNELYKIDNIDDVIFDVSLFKHYAQIKASALFYQFASIVFAASIFVLLLFNILIGITAKEERMRNILSRFIAYMFSATAGFLIIWTVCLFYNYPLLLGQEAIFIIIPLTASLGILYKD